jgi:hypothetical protein
MALIKTDSNITDIRGTVGGQNFKRDASGLHIIAKQRHVKKTRTPEQQSQNDWYCQLKREEHHGGPPAPDEPEPQATGTALVYPAAWIGFIKQRTIIQPGVINMNDHPEDIATAGVFVLDNWDIFRQIPGLTPLIVSEMVVKLFYEYVYTWGVVPAEATLLAQQEVLAWANVTIAKNAIFFTRIVGAGYAGIILCAVIYDFFKRRVVYHNFTTGQAVIEINRNFYWGNLVARPSQYMFDFAIGPALPGPPITTYLHYSPDSYITYPTTFLKLYQSIIERTLYWDVYTWDTIDLSSRFAAYRTQTGLYRSRLDSDYAHYYNHAIGWKISGDPFAFVANIYP